MTVGPIRTTSGPGWTYPRGRKGRRMVRAARSGRPCPDGGHRDLRVAVGSGGPGSIAVSTVSRPCGRGVCVVAASDPAQPRRGLGRCRLPGHRASGAPARLAPADVPPIPADGGRDGPKVVGDDDEESRHALGPGWLLAGVQGDRHVDRFAGDRDLSVVRRSGCRADARRKPDESAKALAAKRRAGQPAAAEGTPCGSRLFARGRNILVAHAGDGRRVPENESRRSRRRSGPGRWRASRTLSAKGRSGGGGLRALKRGRSAWPLGRTPTTGSTVKPRMGLEHVRDRQAEPVGCEHAAAIRARAPRPAARRARGRPTRCGAHAS